MGTAYALTTSIYTQSDRERERERHTHTHTHTEYGRVGK